MKVRYVLAQFLVFISFSTLAITPAHGQGHVLTLKECYEMSLAHSESLFIQEDTIKIAEAHYLQALGMVLPHLHVIGTEIIQDTSTIGGPIGASEVGSTLTRRSRPEMAIQLTQPLFQGMREFLAVKIANVERTKNSLTIERARQLLFSDVARAYYTVLEVERQRTIQSSLHNTLVQRVKELKERIQLGKSRESELLTTESQMASLEADLEKTKGLVATARDYLGFLVGEPVTQKLKDEFKTPGRLPSLGTYIAKLDNRPDLQASKDSIRLAQGQLDYEKGGRYPTLDFVGNYYPYRVGFLKDINWDMKFTLDIPIFSGGAVRGLIREATAKLDQTRFSDQLANRQAEQDLRQSYDTLKSSLAQERALRRAESKAGQSFRAQSDEYRLGLVNNLDVLTALREWHAQRLQTNRAYFDTKLQYLDVLVAAGELPPHPNGETE